MTNQEFLNELRECNHSSCDTECLEKEVAYWLKQRQIGNWGS